MEPKFIVICGSTRFIERMRVLEEELVWAGNVVFAPTKFDMKKANPRWADPVEFSAGALRLAEGYHAAIRRADELLVVGDYAGDSVRQEVSYAEQLGVPVKFTDLSLAIHFRKVLRP